MELILCRVLSVHKGYPVDKERRTAENRISHGITLMRWRTCRRVRCFRCGEEIDMCGLWSDWELYAVERDPKRRS